MRSVDAVSYTHLDVYKRQQEDSCVSLDLRVWCNTEDYWDIKYYLEEQVKLAFDEAGVTIPFPQMDVHVRK